MKGKNFWSVQLSPGQTYVVSLQDENILKITNACIISENDIEDSTTQLYAQSQIHLTGEHPLLEEKWILLASFLPRKNEHQVLNFEMKNGILQNRGFSKLSICGIISAPCLDYDEEEEEEEQLLPISAFGL